MTDVLVIGGGITGLATALELAEAGAATTLIEARRLGAMASTWTLGGVRQSGRDPAELPLAIAAVARWASLHEELGAPTGYRRHGNLRLARSEAEAETIRAMVAAQRALGLDLRYLPDRDAVRAVAPAIGDAVLAASFCPDDGHADPDATIAALAQAARRRGVRVLEGTPALGLVRDGDWVSGARTPEGALLADRTIIANGLGAPALLAGVGLSLPMAAKRVCVYRTVPVEPCFAQVFGVANADCAGRQEIDGAFRITTGIGDWPSGADGWTEQSLRPSLCDIRGLIERSTPLLPVLADCGLDRVWGGLIDLTPDALPVLEAPASHPGLVVGAGFSGHGFGIGPVSGEILADLALGRPPRFDLGPFRLDRFAGAKPEAALLTLHG